MHVIISFDNQFDSSRFQRKNNAFYYRDHLDLLGLVEIEENLDLMANLVPEERLDLVDPRDLRVHRDNKDREESLDLLETLDLEENLDNLEHLVITLYGLVQWIFPKDIWISHVEQENITKEDVKYSIGRKCVSRG